MPLLNQNRGANPAAGRFEQIAGQRIAAMAEALGMHADFVRDVGQRGQDAIIDRVEETDPMGSLGKILRIVQQVGTWMEERASRGRPPQGRELTIAVGKLARRYQMDPDTANEMVMRILERYRELAGELGMGGEGGNATAS